VEDLSTQAQALLEAGGCTGIRITGAGEDWHVAAFLASSDGVAHEAVAFSKRNPATPNDPLYLAGQLLATLQRNAAAHERGLGLIPPPAPEPAPEGLELGAELLADEGEAEQNEHSSAASELVTPPDAADYGQESAAEESAIDADFTDASFVLENRPDDIEVEEPQPTDPGGVAYFGDNIHTIKLAKMGRLSQIARARKAEFQAGWTLEEFASLQNLIVRIDQELAPDDAAARERFLTISALSAAMSTVDAYRADREAELEAADRDGIEAFDPEYGWP